MNIWWFSLYRLNESVHKKMQAYQNSKKKEKKVEMIAFSIQLPNIFFL